MSSFLFIEKEEYCQNLGNFGHYPGWPVLKGCRHGWIPAHQSCNQSKTVAWGRLEEQGLVPSQLLVSFKFQCFVPDSWQWSRSKTQKKCFELRGRQPARENLDLQKRTIVKTKTKTNSNTYKHKYTKTKTITNSKVMFTVDREKTAAEIPRIYLQLEKFFRWYLLLN